MPDQLRLKVIYGVIFLAITSQGYPQEELFPDPVTRPVLSLRCKELFKERSAKIKVQQRLNALFQRSDELLRKTPKNKKTLTAKITSNRLKIRNELYLANLQISTMEENIIRSGCPGLSLQ